MEKIQASEARKNFSETINRVAYLNERIILNKNGKDVVAIISLDDLKLLERLEDELDNKACDEALKESSESIPYDEVRKELGLS